MAQKNEANAESQKQNDDEKIVLTKEELETSAKIMQELIKQEHKKANTYAATSGLLNATQQITSNLAMSGPVMFGASLASRFLSLNAENWNLFEATYLTTKTGNKAEIWVHKEFDKRPQMERKNLNPEHIQQYSDRMADCTSCYMMQKAKLWSAGFSGAAGVGIAAFSVFTAPISAPVLAVAGISTAIAGTAQFLLNQKLKDKKVENKGKIDDDRKEAKAYSREMYANSDMRDHTSSHEQSYGTLGEKMNTALSHSKSFLSILKKYTAYFSGLQYAAAAVTFGAGMASGIGMYPAILLSTGVLTTASAAEKLSSAYLGIKEYIESFGLAYHKFKKGVQNFYYGKEKVKENSNVIQLDRIKYNFRDNNPKSETYGNYTDNLAFETKEEIRFGPGVTVLSGASGAGKSTLISLLAHGDHVTGGAIHLGTMDESGKFFGQDYKDIGRNGITDKIAYACSSPSKVSCNIDEYIRLGNPDISDEKLQEIKNLLELQTTDESGKPKMMSSISGGELARVSLAQAFVRDAPIMIFDEPTSPLDARMSKIVVDHIKKLSKQGKTIIFTTHKPEDIEQIKPYQAVDIDRIYSQDGNTKTIKKYTFGAAGALSSFVDFFRKRQISEEKKKTEVATDRLQKVTQKVKDRMHQPEIESISKELLIEYKTAKGKSNSLAAQQASAVFSQITKDER